MLKKDATLLCIRLLCHFIKNQKTATPAVEVRSVRGQQQRKPVLVLASVCTPAISRSTSLDQLAFASGHHGPLGAAVKEHTAQPEWIYSLWGLGPHAQ